MTTHERKRVEDLVREETNRREGIGSFWCTSKNRTSCYASILQKGRGLGDTVVSLERDIERDDGLPPPKY